MSIELDLRSRKPGNPDVEQSPRGAIRGPGRSFVRVLFVFVGALVVIPLLLLLAYALRDAPLYESAGSWTFASWAIVWGRGTLDLFARTGVFVVVTLFVGALLSLPSAWLLERTSIRGRKLWRALIIASMALAPGVLAFSWVLLARRESGALTQILHNIPALGAFLSIDVQTVAGMGFVGGLAVTSTAYTMVAPSFRMIGGDMEDASYMSGAGPVETVRRIVAPLARPAITGALLIMAIIMLGSLEVPAIVGSVPGVSVFADRIFRELQPQMGLPSHNTAAVLGVMLLAIALALLALYQRAHKQSRRYAVVVGRGYATRRMKLGRWEIAAQAYLLLVVSLILIIPALMLFWASITPFYRVPTAPNAFDGLSAGVYASLAGEPGIGKAVLNSIEVVIAGASLAMLLGALVAWVNVRIKTRAAYYLGTLAFVPIGIPTVLVAISVFLTFLYVPIGLTGTIFILIVAYVTNYLAFAFLFMRTAVGQISEELEEASYVSGAGLWTTLARVTGPLLIPAVATAWMWIGAHILRDMTIAPALLSPDNVVLGSYLWQRIANGETAIFSALGLVLTLFLFVVVLAWESIGGRSYDRF